MLFYWVVCIENHKLKYSVFAYSHKVQGLEVKKDSLLIPLQQVYIVTSHILMNSLSCILLKTGHYAFSPIFLFCLLFPI